MSDLKMSKKEDLAYFFPQGKKRGGKKPAMLNELKEKTISKNDK